MQFVSIEYLCFLGAVVVFLRVSPSSWRTPLLLVASYAFYCTWSIRMAAVLLLATAVCYFAALRLEAFRGRKEASIWTLCTVTALVLFLVFFKARPLLCS